MLNHRIDRHSQKQSQSPQTSAIQKQALVQNYLQSPSLSWSKLSGLLEVEGLNN